MDGEGVNKGYNIVKLYCNLYTDYNIEQMI